MKLDLFANRILRAQASNGVVRMEFGVVAVDEKGEALAEAALQPEEVTFTVNMPLAGFTRSIVVLRQLAQELQQRAAQRRQEDPGTPGPSRGEQRRLQDLTRDDEPSGEGGTPSS